jgi:RNA-splicing ligase RtcB
VATRIPYGKARSILSSFSSNYRKRIGGTAKPPFDFEGYDEEYFHQLCSRVGVSEAAVGKDAGTPGGGNHFVELGKSRQTDEHWLVVHCGSRRFGKAIADYWIERADGHPKMGWLEGEDAYGYLVDMVFAQQYAAWNRHLIGEAARDALDVEAVDKIESTHNYVDATDLVVRKGAARAHNGQKAIVPLNAADGILLCEGRGNESANRSAPHGAGRILSRSDAKQVVGEEQAESELADVATAGEVPISEAPQAYKDPDFLLRHIGELAEPVDHLVPILNLKHH